MDLIVYLDSLPPIKLSRLYDSPFTCMAVLRSLPPLAKQYVLRMLFLDSGVSQGLVSSWILPTAASQHHAALETLSRLQVLAEVGHPKPAYRLAPAFQGHLRAAVCSGLSPHLGAVPDEVSAAAPGKDALDEYASAQWEHLLLFLVGTNDTPPPPPADFRAAVPLDVGTLLLSAGLVVKEEASLRTGVTQAGFQFLLTDTYSQLWLLLRQYIAAAERQSSAELASVISFLLQLGFQGQRCTRAGGLAPLERSIAAHMAQLGLLKTFRSGDDVWLCPTHLAVTMACGAGAAAGAAHDGFVVTETNFRLYAYTASPVRQAILRLFVRCEVLLPNLFVGTITRETVTAALDHGVGAEQIVCYLRQHAHPRVAARVPIVPGVVADQVRLWQRELQRLGAQLMRDDAAGELVVAAGAHEQVKAEIRRMKVLLGL